MTLPFSRKKGADTPNWKIFRAAVTVGIAGMVAKSGIAAKELFVASIFGRSDALDAFLIAFLLPSFVVNLVMGSLGAAFVPVFIDVREKHGRDGAQRLLSSVLALSIAALAVLIIILGLLAPFYLPLLGSSFSAEKLHLTRELLYLILPFIFFNGIGLFFSGVLNAGEKFALPAVVPLITPLITIMFLQIAGGEYGPFCLVGGVLAGSLIETGLLVRALAAQGLTLKLRWYGLHPDTREVLSQYAPVFASSFLMCSTTVVDQAMAAMLASGSVAALSYANKVVGLVLAVCGTALSTASLPYFSQMVARQDWEGCRHTLKRFSGLVILATVPFTLTLIGISTPLVRLLFQRGAFTGADTALVGQVQALYAIQIPFYVCGMLFVRFLSAARRNDVLMYGSAISLVLDIGLNLAFMKIWGVAGIALSTSLVYVTAFLFLGAFSVKVVSQAPLSTAANAHPRAAIRRPTAS